MICLIGFLQVWHPKRVWTFEGEEAKTDHRAAHGYSRGEVARAWLPWLILSVIVFCWGTVTFKKMVNTPEKVFTSMASWSTPPSKITSPAFPIHGLNKLVERVPPVVAEEYQGARGIYAQLGECNRNRHLCGRDHLRTDHGIQHRADL